MASRSMILVLALGSLGCRATAGSSSSPGPSPGPAPSPVSPASPAPVARQGTIAQPMTGDPIPQEPVEDPACEDRASTVTRWLGWRPRVPLAVSDEGVLGPAGVHCCAPWARRGARWRAVDPWGQVLGVATVEGGEGYDVTQCFELELRPEALAREAVVFASERGRWEPRPRVEWVPTVGERAGLQRMLARVHDLYLMERSGAHSDEGPAEEPVPGPLFFRLPEANDHPDNAGRHPTRFVVAGGPVLVVAYLAADDRWRVAYVHHYLKTHYGPRSPYRPLAVFDMNLDDYPEVIYQWNEGPAWADVVLEVEPYVRSAWHEVAESIGGATI